VIYSKSTIKGEERRRRRRRRSSRSRRTRRFWYSRILEFWDPGIGETETNKINKILKNKIKIIVNHNNC